MEFVFGFIGGGAVTLLTLSCMSISRVSKTDTLRWLLKKSVDDLNNSVAAFDVCPVCERYAAGCKGTEKECEFRWRYMDEVEEVLSDEP